MWSRNVQPLLCACRSLRFVGVVVLDTLLPIEVVGAKASTI